MIKHFYAGGALVEHATNESWIRLYRFPLPRGPTSIKRIKTYRNFIFRLRNLPGNINV